MLLSISFQAKPFPNLPFSFSPPGPELPWPEFLPFPAALHSQVPPQQLNRAEEQGGDINDPLGENKEKVGEMPGCEVPSSH